MQERKAVFFDIDGTLFEIGRGVPESTVRAIRQLRRNGNLAFVCSGRSRIMIPASPIMDIGFDGVVAACGMYGSMGEEVFFRNEMTSQQISAILPVLQRTKTMYILEGTEYIYYDKNTIDLMGDDWYIQSIKAVSRGHFVSLPEQTENIHACKISMRLPVEHTQEILSAAQRDFQVLIHQGNIAEAVPHGFTKAEGIRQLCKRLGISRENTIAVGDSINDVDMLKFAGIGIAMGNGTEIAKKSADYVTTDLYKDGIWNALSHFELCGELTDI